MDKHPTGKVELERFAKKETYTAEEKKFIMDRLNEQRLIHQRAAEEAAGKKRFYTEEEKKKILQKLNERRLSTQKREEIQQRRTYKKKIYTFGGKKCYKFTKMERDYFIEISDLKKLSSRPAMIRLYYNSIDELKRKDVLMKTEIYSDKFFISHDPIRVYYKQYALEDEK
ncbi:MAG TPA: hypothetical protein VIM88_02765 [Sulfurovum sp.]|uniref:hypothetical protein n=1 Tax=Sulfurovum sp. TaxID=1969726 RepID=UPI002F93C7D6